MLREPVGHLGPEQAGLRGQRLCNKRQEARERSRSENETSNFKRGLPSLLETAGTDQPRNQTSPRGNLVDVRLLSSAPLEAGCSQEEGPKKGFVMGSRARGAQEILEKCM